MTLSLTKVFHIRVSLRHRHLLAQLALMATLFPGRMVIPIPGSPQSPDLSDQLAPARAPLPIKMVDIPISLQLPVHLDPWVVGAMLPQTNPDIHRSLASLVPTGLLGLAKAHPQAKVLHTWALPLHLQAIPSK